MSYYNFNDFIYVIRGDGFKSKRYHHFCSECNTDRGYSYKNKILKDLYCHSCSMKQKEVLSKISLKSKGRFHSEQTKFKISKSLYRGIDFKNKDETLKLKRNLRSRLNKAIKHNNKSGSAVNDLGCSIDFLKQYLESKFLPSMSWENYGRSGWHIDHIRSLNSFNLNNRQELLKACHYSNLQPLWAKDNLSKGCK